MKFQSLYYLTNESIVYQQLYSSDIQIPFADINLIAESRPGFITSKAMDTLINNPQSSLQAVYHLAAIHEKYLPSNWDWEGLLYRKEQAHYEQTAGETAYLKSKGKTKRPTFDNDFDADNYELILIGWAKENELYKSDEEIQEQTEQKIQELIIARSKTEFIELTNEQINLIIGVIN